MEKHRPKKLLDQVREAIWLRHCSCCTDQAYFGWIERSIRFQRAPRGQDGSRRM